MRISKKAIIYIIIIIIIYICTESASIFDHSLQLGMSQSASFSVVRNEAYILVDDTLQ